MTGIRRIAGSTLARLIMGYVLVSLVFASAWLWSLYGPLNNAVLQQQRASLTAVAQSAALVVADSADAPASIVRELVARTDLRLTIVAGDGTVLADSDTDPSLMENHAGRTEIRAALAGRVGSAVRVSRSEGTAQLYVAVPATLSHQRVAVRVSQPLTEIRAIAARTRHASLLLLAVALAVVPAIAYGLSRLATRPIAELSRSAEAMAAGNLTAPLPQVPTDLQPLTDALLSLRIQMLARLDAAESERSTLAATLDGLTDAVFVLDGDSVRLANQAANKLFRPPSGGWRGTSIAADGLPASLAEEIRKRLGDRVVSAVELEPDPRGRVLRLLVAPLALESAGETRSIVVVSDVTERAQLDRTRSDFVANASHELKTPVAGIKLLADSAATAAEDGDKDQAIAFAVQIAEETNRLQHLVRDLLDLSRLESRPAANALTDVRKAVDDAITAHRSAAGRRGLELAADFSAVRTTDVFVSADGTDVAIALDNLLANAIAYTESGSVTVRVSASDAMVDIAVVDTGCGIAPDHLARVFERFYRVDKGRSRDAGGTGLGLALAKNVAERNGGTITVRSVEGRGTTFSLRLRRAV